MPKINGTMENIVETTVIIIEAPLYFFLRNSGETRFINIAATISINIQTTPIFNKINVFSIYSTFTLKAIYLAKTTKMKMHGPS